jgi:hypothetical protein
LNDTELAWIETFTGHKFHILQPCPKEVHIEDVAHALSLQCRFVGHSKFHYSVAQHAVLVSHIVDPKFAFEALHHDDSEAYISDMSRPLKHFTPAGVAYMAVEGPVQDACNKKWGLRLGPMSPEVKVGDNLILFSEKDALMKPLEWDHVWGDEDRCQIKVRYWPPWFAELRYVHRHYQLLHRASKNFYKDDFEAEIVALVDTAIWAFQRFTGRL